MNPHLSAPDTPTEQRDGIRVDWHVPINTDDGVGLRADVYRPQDEARHPVVITYGPYGKGLAFQEGYAPQWEKLVADHPDAVRGTSNRYANWEVVDPEKWVPDGYAVVRVDSRGAGWSEGVMDVWSPREARDFYQCIEWAAAQPWANGKVGTCGVSYYAMNQWFVAGLQPPHLAAMIPWEGAADYYRDVSYHGGILCDFLGRWFPLQVSVVQNGVGERGRVNPNTGEPVAGPVTLSDEELRANRVEMGLEVKKHPLDDEWHRARSADWSKVHVPFLSSANWGGQGLHPRGNFEAFTQAASEQKWLEVHGETHWGPFYSDYALDLQKRFFGHFLKGEDNGWDREPRVRLQVRHPDRFEERTEREWPLARTRWTRLYLDPSERALVAQPQAQASTLEYDAMGDGLTFKWPAQAEPREVTGPLAARLFISSTTADADLFLVVRLFDPHGEEVTFQGALDPNTPIAQGWLRASHRKLDPARSLTHRPYHTHDEVQPLTPGEVYAVDVEIWPTSIVVPPGYQLALTVRGHDYQKEGDLGEFAARFHFASRGCGPFLHEDPDARPADLFGGRVTIHTGGEYDSHLLVPIIP